MILLLKEPAWDVSEPEDNLLSALHIDYKVKRLKLKRQILLRWGRDPERERERGFTEANIGEAPKEKAEEKESYYLVIMGSEFCFLEELRVKSLIVTIAAAGHNISG